MSTVAPAASATSSAPPSTSRKKGLAKFLMAQILRHLHEQFFTVAEIQAPESNVAAVSLIRGLGFTQVDFVPQLPPAQARN